MTAGKSSVEVTWRGPEVADRMHTAAARGLLVAMEHLLTVANMAVPIDEGTLEGSGVALVDRLELRGIVSYDTPYAVRQHEDLTARHAPGRTAKWLELALMREKGNLSKLVARELRRTTGG